MHDEIIKTIDVEYTYRAHSEGQEGVRAVKGITVSIERGQFVVVIGRNGSGKSTFARLLNALQLPTGGTVYICLLYTSPS
ncbi:MAG: ATP-binding cassette domain-containing protein, partial [Clostridia bacterium]|nr:ATP-binding cassette domain-containing protein [Clostridia bacterium]